MRDLFQEVPVSALREGARRSTDPRLPKNKQALEEQPGREKMMSRFSSFSLAAVLSLASAAPTLAAETNRPPPASQLLSNPADLKDFARRESGFDNRVFIRAPGATGSYFSSQNPYRDFLNGGKPTPAAALLSNPKALLSESRRGSGLDDNRSASTGSFRSASAAVRTHLKQRRLAARSSPE
jgi:hypothetical protein